MAVPITFQQLIQRLNAYWAEQGCVLIQPLDLEVGAGTFHPATFLRALGPEPWNAAYVQPCRRPTDGRYGENPGGSVNRNSLRWPFSRPKSNSLRMVTGSNISFDSSDTSVGMVTQWNPDCERRALA